MSDALRVSGKRFALPNALPTATNGVIDSTGWKFETRPGGWLIATDPAGKRIRLSALELRGKLSFAGPALPAGMGEIIAKSHGGGAGSAQASIEADLTANFPGKVRKILIKAGANVAAGEPLVLVEAMKMEFSIKAPVAGKVMVVRVVEGQQLSPGDRFVDFEPEAEEGGK